MNVERIKAGLKSAFKEAPKHCRLSPKIKVCNITGGFEVTIGCATRVTIHPSYEGFWKTRITIAGIKVPPVYTNPHMYNEDKLFLDIAFMVTEAVKLSQSTATPLIDRPAGDLARLVKLGFIETSKLYALGRKAERKEKRFVSNKYELLFKKINAASKAAGKKKANACGKT